MQDIFSDAPHVLVILLALETTTFQARTRCLENRALAGDGRPKGGWGAMSDATAWAEAATEAKTKSVDLAQQGSHPPCSDGDLRCRRCRPPLAIHMITHADAC